MDWTGYTVVYARNDGSDVNGGTNDTSDAVLTPQRAYQIAYLGSGNHVLDIGATIFESIVPVSGGPWPSRIGIRGETQGTSSVVVIFSGGPADTDYPGNAGLPVSIQSDLSIALSVNTAGSGGGSPSAYSGQPGGSGAAITLTDVVLSAVNATGGPGSSGVDGSGGIGGWGGSILLTRCVVSGNIDARGGDGGQASGGGDYSGTTGGPGGGITLIDTSCSGGLLCWGGNGGGPTGAGNGGHGGNAGPITLTNSSGSYASCYGGGPTGGQVGGNGGYGGAFTMTAGSSIGAVDAQGASGSSGAYNNGWGGDAGIITATDSHFTGGALNTSGGGGLVAKNASAINITNCTHNAISNYTISANGGSASAGPSDGSDQGGGSGGAVIITGFRRAGSGVGLFSIDALPGSPTGYGAYGAGGTVNITRATKAFLNISVGSNGTVNFYSFCSVPAGGITAGSVEFANYKPPEKLNTGGL